MREQTWQILSGDFGDGATKSFVATSYARIVKIVTLAVSSAPTVADMTMQFRVNGVLNAQVFTLPQGSLTQQINASSNGIALAIGDILQVLVVAASGALDLAVTIECEVSTTGTADDWFVPTIGTLQSAIASTEYNEYVATALQTGQADPVPQILSAATGEIRAAIRTGMKNDLGPAGSIPSEAENLFLQIAQWWFFKRVKSVALGDKQLNEMRTWANGELEKIGAGKKKFIQPTTVLETVPSGTYGYEEYIPVDPFDETQMVHGDTP